MNNETDKKSMAEALTSGFSFEEGPTAAEPEAKKHRRRSVIEKELLPGATGEEIKARRKRKTKPAELRKSHSFTILMTEQMYQQFKKIAESKELSMNGIITRLIKKYIMVHDIDDEDDGI